VLTPQKAEGAVPLRKEALLANVTVDKQEVETLSAILPFRFNKRVPLLQMTCRFDFAG
jgi:hypothetical protein